MNGPPDAGAPAPRYSSHQPAPPYPPPPGPPRPRETKWLPTIGLLLVLVFVSIGGFVLAGDVTVGGDGIVDEGGEPVPPIQVSDGVAVRPAPGWRVADQQRDPPSLRLVRGAGFLFVLVSEQTETARALGDRYVAEVLEPQATQLSVSQVQPVELPSGNPAVFLSYVGLFEGVETPLEGEVVAEVGSSGAGAVFDAWAAEGSFAGIRGDVHSMVSGAEVS